jgi:hypothetical protein
MIEQLLNLIQQQGQDAVVNNPAIPNEHNEQVMSAAGQSIVGGLQQALAGGGLSQVLSLFSGGSSTNSLASLASNPLVQNIISSFAGQLTNGMQVAPQQAQQVGSDLIPQVLSRLSGQVSDPANASIDINSVMKTLTGGGTGSTDFSGLLQQFQQGGDAASHSGLQDLIGSVSKAASEQGGGGLMDMLKGFMK